MSAFDPLKRWLRYKWEFLRRDPEYRKAYKEILPLRIENKYTLTKTALGGPYLQCEPAKYSQEEIDYCHYFEFGPPLLDPDLSFEKLINKYYSWDDPVKEITDTEENLFLNRIAGIAYNKLIISIDFTKINSIDALSRIVKNLIKHRWLEYKKQNKIETKKIREELDKVLFVGELKLNNPNLTWPEIAKQAFPGATEDQKSAVNKSRQHYDRYMKLTNGGWRDLKFP